MAYVFPLGKEQLVISDELAAYNELRQAFIPLANEAEATFKSVYEQENHDLESMIQNFPDQVTKCLNIVIDHCISKMMEQGIYDIDREIFTVEYCSKYVTVVERFEEYLTKFSEINGDLEASREYREYRKATRGMFIGGGFGVQGAIKGAVTAGALNMSTGLAHSIANGIGNMWDKAVAKHRMETLFNDPLTLCDLANAVWESAFNMHYAYIDVLESRNDIEIPKFSMDNIRKSQAIYQNLSRLELPFEQAQKPLCEMFSLQPYEYEYYQFVILKYGDADNQLQKIGEFFHINMNEMKMVLLQTIISGAINYEKMESDIEDILGRLEEISGNFGIPKKEIKNIVDRIRSSYFAYKFSSSIEEKTGLYLPQYSFKEKVTAAYRQYKSEVRQCAAEEFNHSWDERTTDGYLIGPDEIDTMRSEYRDYLLLFSVNSERKDFVFRLSDTLLEYGRGRVCRVSRIKEVEVRNNSLIINRNTVIPLSCERLDEKLTEKLIGSIIRIIQSVDKSGVTKLLGTYTPTEQEQQVIANVDTYVSGCAKEMKRYAGAYSVLYQDDLEHLMVYYNICEKMKLQTKKSFAETPVILFKNRVTTSLLDDTYTDTEYNKTLFKVTSDEYTLFTGKNVVFTANGAVVPISKMKDISVDKEDGSLFINHNGEKLIITNFIPEASLKIKELIERILRIYQGESVESKNTATESVEEYMSEIYTKVMNYAKKRLAKEDRETVFSHVLINCNNEEFDKVLDRFTADYPFLKEQEVLFLLCDSETEPEYACFVTKKGICHIYEAQNDNKYCGFGSPKKMLSLKKVESFEKVIDKKHGYQNNLHINYYEGADNKTVFYTCLFPFEKDVIGVSHSIVTIANMMLDLICEKEKIKRIKKEGADSVLDEINSILNDMPALGAKEKFLFVLNKAKGQTPVYTMLENAEKYFDRSDTPVVFMYNDALLKPGAHGIIITPNKLYFNIVPEKGCIPLKDILEVRDKDGRVAVIITETNRYELMYTDPGEMNLSQLTKFISELVFLLQERGEHIAEELQGAKKEKEAEREKRKQKGVYNFVQRSAVAKIKKFYTDHKELHGTANFYFNDGTSEFERKINDLKIKFNSNIDNIEVPLIAVHSVGHEKREGFILTNERWHHMVAGSTTYRVGRDGIKWAGSEPSLTQENEIILLKDGENDYRVCKVKDHQRKGFVEFLELIIKSKEELSGKIDLSARELQQKKEELNQLIAGYEEKSDKELRELLKTIREEYPLDFSQAAVKQLEEQIKLKAKERGEETENNPKSEVSRVDRQNTAWKYDTESIDLSEEYEALRPLVEPIIPTIEAHIARVRGELLNYKIMEWNGDPEVIRGEKAPILVVMHDANCSPRLSGKGAINAPARFILGILPDYFYIVNQEKFILYVKGEKNTWRISELRNLNFKDGFLSSSLLVTDVIGTVKKISIDSSFKAHVDGLNKILSFLRDNRSTGTVTPTVPQVTPVVQNEPVSQVTPMVQNEPVSQVTPVVQNEPVLHVTPMVQNDIVSQDNPAPQEPEVLSNTESEAVTQIPAPAPEGVVSMADIKRSFSEMADYVNKFPALERGSFLGTLNPKFGKKVKNAVKAYAITVREDEIFALYDDTLLGSGKEGFVMTSKEMIIKTSLSATFKCAYADITGFKIIYKEAAKLTGLSVDTKFGRAQITGWLGEAGSKDLANRINEIVKYLFDMESVPYSIEKETIAR